LTATAAVCLTFRLSSSFAAMSETLVVYSSFSPNDLSRPAAEALRMKIPTCPVRNLSKKAFLNFFLPRFFLIVKPQMPDFSRLPENLGPWDVTKAKGFPFVVNFPVGLLGFALYSRMCSLTTLALTFKSFLISWDSIFLAVIRDLLIDDEAPGLPRF